MAALEDAPAFFGVDVLMSGSFWIVDRDALGVPWLWM
jgi:hypothetical protein